MEILSTRSLMRAAGGPLEAGQNLKSWLAHIADQCGLSMRVVSAAWHGEQVSARTIAALAREAGKHEARDVANRLERLCISLSSRDPYSHYEDIVRIGEIIQRLRRMDSPETKK